MGVVKLLQRESAIMKQDRSTPIKEAAEQSKRTQRFAFSRGRHEPKARTPNPECRTGVLDIPKPHARRCISPNS